MNNFFKNIKKVFSEEDQVNNQEILQEQVANADPERVIKTMARDDEADFKLLVSLYRKYKSNEQINVLALVKKVNFESTSHKCPYCGVIHEFTASRARKCPACANKMVVRQEQFITEDQAKEVDTLVQ